MAEGGELVVVATNGSPASRRAVVRSALLFADADLIAAVVVPAAPHRDPPGDPLVPMLTLLRRAGGAERLSRTAAGLGELCSVLGRRARPAVLHGDPATALHNLARLERADLIVVGSLDGAGRRAGASTAQQLLADAPCPVLELGR